MSIGKYILVNGSFIPTDEYRISLSESETFLFSEKIRSIQTVFPFFKETLEIIKLQLRIFGHTFPDFTSNDGAGLKRQLERTLTKNKHFLGAVFIISFRYTDQKLHYTIQSKKLDNTSYELNDKGLYVELFEDISKPASSISMFSLGSTNYWNIAKNQLTNPMIDHFLITNTENQIIEIPESNIYIIKGKFIRGASSKHGAYHDISKPHLLVIFAKSGLQYSEVVGITIQDLREAEEIMVVNTIEGIRWIVGFEGKRFFNNTIRKIGELFKRSVLV